MSETTAKTQQKTKTSNGLKWKKYLIFFTIFVVLLYLLSLVVINTSWAKNKLSNRLKVKTNTEWQVGNVLWVPFGKIELQDLNTTMGEGGIHIESLEVNPSWSDLFSGSLELKEATVSEANVDLDLKWLKENMSKSKDAVIAQAPVPDQPPNQPHPQPKPPVTGEPTHAKPPVKPAPKQPNKPVVAKKPEINDLPNRWLKVDKLNLTVRNGKEARDEVLEMSASIPFAGKPAEGEIRLKFLDGEHVQKVTWDGQGIRAEEDDGNLFGINYQWQAACKMSQPGMPFAFRFKAPEQKLNHSIDRPNLHLNISADSVAGNFALSGSLRSLNTWRGIISAGSTKTIISENQKTHKRMEFDHTRLVGTITNGVLKVPAAEAIGYKVSILANGVIHKNLYSYGVVRLITKKDPYNFFRGVYHATQFVKIDHHPYHLTFPLDTPDRRYCDFYLDGKLTDLEFRHNRGNSWQPLNPALKKMWDFKNNELQEDGLLEPEGQ